MRRLNSGVTLSESLNMFISLQDMEFSCASFGCRRSTYSNARANVLMFKFHSWFPGNSFAFGFKS